ncbi:Mov34/MPN/PAD-1 family protein [Cellulomonas sp.]|uniref:Mov34/MPN/PAD-1 family protein n=1 Tax=Cellulomonas sp. TaxID=40001 RepID=UPI003BA89172
MSGPPALLLALEVLDTMISAGAAALPRETGGILGGFRDGNLVVVTRAVVVSDSGSSRNDYVRRDTVARARLADIRAQAAPVVGYVGEWHTHPADQPPSGTDLATLQQIALEADDLVALIVLPFDGANALTPHSLIGASARTRARRRSVLTWSAPVEISELDAAQLESCANTAHDTEGIPPGAKAGPDAR